jgi:hypothetical protein
MRQVFVPLLEARGADLVLAGHSHTYERSYLLDGHYGYSWTFQPAMKLNRGNGRIGGDGPYVKGSSGPTSRQGTIYIEAGSSSQARADGPMNHPAMCVSKAVLGSLVIDIADNQLTCRFLRETGAIDDEFTLIKGVAAASFRIQAHRPSPSGTQLSWSSATGQVFNVSRRQDLNQAWTRVAASVLATNSVTTWLDTNSPPTNAFYQVEN